MDVEVLRTQALPRGRHRRGPEMQIDATTVTPPNDEGHVSGGIR